MLATTKTLFADITWELPSYGLLVLGGFGRFNADGMGVPVDDFEPHLLLAEFFLDSGDVGDDFGTDYTTVFYVCFRKDLAARRFEAVEMVSDSRITRAGRRCCAGPAAARARRSQLIARPYRTTAPAAETLYR